MALAMLRLVMRAGLDDDPLLGDIAAETDRNRKSVSIAGRNAARRARSQDAGGAEGPVTEAAE